MDKYANTSIRSTAPCVLAKIAASTDGEEERARTSVDCRKLDVAAGPVCQLFPRINDVLDNFERSKYYAAFGITFGAHTNQQ